MRMIRLENTQRLVDYSLEIYFRAMIVPLFLEHSKGFRIWFGCQQRQVYELTVSSSRGERHLSTTAVDGRS
jgi:hypothetical protein